MKISCAVALLAVVASAIAATPSSEGQKTSVVPSPVQQQLPVAAYPGPVGAQFPAQSYQFPSEYNYGPFGKSAAYAPRSAAVPASSFGSYQPYQQQQSYNFGPYQQQSYFPAAGYPATAAGSYPTAYSSQQTGAAHYPTPYSAYPAPYSSYPYSAQPYHGAAAYSSSYPGAFQPYNGQYVASPSSPPYNSHYAATVPSVTPYSALPSVYQQPQSHPSFYSSTSHPYGPSQQYQQSAQQYQQSAQQYQYPSFYNSQNSPAAASAVTVAAADSTVTKAETK